MRILAKSLAVLPFLALGIGTASYAPAAPALEVTQNPQEISGIDRDSGVAFRATLPADEYVIIDASVGTKQIHAEIDYKLKKIQIRSLSKSSGSLQALTPQDIIAFQKLRVTLPSGLNTATRHGDALASFVNLMASAPPVAINLSILNDFFTPICDLIGSEGEAVYRLLGTIPDIHVDDVTVGPVCYVAPATGRCGQGGGPDTFPFPIGWVQRFTQECLNHDRCCDVTGGNIVCGATGTRQCVPEFLAAVPSFFFAPDCGTTEGKWKDVTPNFPIGPNYTIMGGDSSAFGGGPTMFTGTVDVDNGYYGCMGQTTWPLKGTRDGQSVQFTATNPTPANFCPPSVKWTGTFNDCNTAKGSETWAPGGGEFPNGVTVPWSWQRTSAPPS